jgi:hypothetical protein
MNFNDIKFGTHPNGRGIQGKLKVNGFTLSVVAGSFMHSTPREDLNSPDDFSSFEIAVFDSNGDWATQTFFPDLGDDVKGWVSEDEITELIGNLQNHIPNNTIAGVDFTDSLNQLENL